MKGFLLSSFLLFVVSISFGQRRNRINIAKKLPNFIQNADRRKIEKAKSLLNEGRILEGEKILVALRNDNMNQAYFHESLVQIQKQILDLKVLQKNTDEEDGEYFLDEQESWMPDLNLEENFISNGLARSREQKIETLKSIRLAPKDRKKLKKLLEDVENSNEELNPIDAAKGQLEMENEALRNKEKEQEIRLQSSKKNAKEANDILLIPYESYKYQLINTGRLATLKHERVDSASHYLRILKIDTIDYGNILSMEETDSYHNALNLFYSGDYRRAAKLFEKITLAHDDYFPAQDYLGKSYFNIGLDTPTLLQYISLAQNFKERPEGLVGLSDYFLAKGEYKKAGASIIKAIAIYPEDAYFVKLDNILKRSGQRLNSQWIRREVYPITTANNFEEIIAKEKSPWRYYQNAGAELHSYASPEGIIRANEITNERYLELYAWQEMLKDHDELALEIKDPQKRAAYLAQHNAKKKEKEEEITFPFARSMQKMGMLDCYVFITLFHNDIYPAFKEFVMLNPEKIERYFTVLLNWNDTRFDKYRVGTLGSNKSKDETGRRE